MKRKASRLICAVFAAAFVLGACAPRKDSAEARPAEEASGPEQESAHSEVVTAGRFLKEELEAVKPAEKAGLPAGQAENPEKPGEDSQAALGESNPASSGEPRNSPEGPEGRSGEEGEQTAVYTQAYSESGIYIEASVRLQAKGDLMYRLEEQLELSFRMEELDLEPEPEDMEEMLDMTGELFQGMMDEYEEIEGVAIEFFRQEDRFFMSISCEITEETAQGIVDGGFLEVDEAEELLSFRKVCEALEAENYTRSQ